VSERPMSPEDELSAPTETPRKTAAPEGDSGLLAGSNRVLDAAWDWLRKTGIDVSARVDRQRRAAWCDRAIVELREDREAILDKMGKYVYRSYREGMLTGGQIPASPELLEWCRAVEDLNTKIEAQKLLRERIMAGGQAPPPPAPGTEPSPPPAEAGDA